MWSVPGFSFVLQRHSWRATHQRHRVLPLMSAALALTRKRSLSRCWFPFSFHFHPDVAEKPRHNRDALSLLASATTLLSSLGLLAEWSRCPTANTYSHQSYRFSPDARPPNAAVLYRAWHPGKWLACSLIGAAFWNASLACLNVSCAQPIAGSHLVG